MKGISIVGIVLVLIGVAGFAFGGLSFTTRETTLDLGAIQLTSEEKHKFPIPAIATGLAVAAGLVLVVMGARKA
jgi:hypothetical protein